MGKVLTPISVTIIGWYLIVTSAISVFFIPFAFREPMAGQMFRMMQMPPSVYVAFVLAGALATLTSGIAMLNRLQWGRLLYLALTPLLLIVSSVLQGFKFPALIVMSLLAYGIIAFLLTRRPVSDYFAGRETVSPMAEPAHAGSPDQTTTAARKIVAALLLIPAGFALLTLFMTIGPMSEHPAAALFLAGLFGIPALGLVIAAVFLWGRRKWAGVVGTFLLAAGALSLMVSIAMQEVTSHEEFRIRLTTVDPALFEGLTHGSMVYGLAAAIAGGLLLGLHRTTTGRRSPDAGPGKRG